MKDDTSIALIKKDIQYLKDGIDDIKNTLSCLDKKYPSMEKYNLEVGPLVKAKDKIVWLVVSSVIIALLSVVLSNGVLAK